MKRPTSKSAQVPGDTSNTTTRTDRRPGVSRLLRGSDGPGRIPHLSTTCGDRVQRVHRVRDADFTASRCRWPRPRRPSTGRQRGRVSPRLRETNVQVGILRNPLRGRQCRRWPLRFLRAEHILKDGASPPGEFRPGSPNPSAGQRGVAPDQSEDQSVIRVYEKNRPPARVPLLRPT